MRLKVDKKAPHFILPDENKEKHSLVDYEGKWILLYFYPRDDTPGCTTEALEFTEEYKRLKKLGVVILGVSKDTSASHKRFIEKYSFPFTLLSDIDKATAKRYDSLGRKKFMGKEYMGVLRNSYLINPEGFISKIYEDVLPKDHAKEVLLDVKALQT